ncbi:MAG: CDP-glycerol glycerophosphotransferase family protein [Acidimicrobiia bacterium]
MAGFLSRIKSQMRERESVQAIFDTPIADKPLVAYAEDDYTWNQLGPYLTSAMDDFGIPTIYVTSDPDDPRLVDHHDLMSVYFVREVLPSFLPKIDSAVFLTTMPDLDTFHLKRPQTSTCVYAFHSLNSIHMAYRAEAFDAYDVFYCVGPHHKTELRAHFDRTGRPDVDLREVGYPKLDRIHRDHQAYQKVHPSDTTVLIAPSWGENNILAATGEAVIDSLSQAGFRTVVRPHPAFFESIYPEGESIVRHLQQRFIDRESVVFETSTTTESSFLEADLMVSDWSGAAYEYALGTERPVLFVDLPPKVKNEAWADLGVVPFEDRMRHEVGLVVDPQNAGSIAQNATSLLEDATAYGARLAELRDACVYNNGTAAVVGASIIDEIVKATPSPTARR